MQYVIAGYVFVLSLLALYAVSLAWRRHRLSRLADRVVAASAESVAGAAAAPGEGGR